MLHYLKASKRLHVWLSTVALFLIIGGSCHKDHFCHNKHVFCRYKSMLVTTKLCLYWQNSFVMTKVSLSRQKWYLWQLPLIDSSCCDIKTPADIYQFCFGHCAVGSVMHFHVNYLKLALLFFCVGAVKYSYAGSDSFQQSKTCHQRVRGSSGRWRTDRALCWEPWFVLPPPSARWCRPTWSVSTASSSSPVSPSPSSQTGVLKGFCWEGGGGGGNYIFVNGGGGGGGGVFWIKHWFIFSDCQWTSFFSCLF